MDKAKGELMKVSGFGPLQALQKVRPEDYKNYLKAVSATNKAVKYPQFHAVISAEGKSYDKFALTEVAEKWLVAMGYGNQPYLIVYHHDTNNSHVHMVTTRVNKEGEKIRDSFENIKAVTELNRILGIDEKHSAKANIEKALSYQFSTKAQFMMILESKGYVVSPANDNLSVVKFGRVQGEIALDSVLQRMQNYDPGNERTVQLKALFHKYAALSSTQLMKGRSGYHSEFSDLLKQKFGIELIFHASGDKPPYGYTVIDHAEKTVVKGGSIMPLKEMLEIPIPLKNADVINDIPDVSRVADEQLKEYYAAILKAAIHNYPDLEQGLHHQGLLISHKGDSFNLYDPGAGICIDTSELLDEKEYRLMVNYFSQLEEIDDEVYRQYQSMPEVYIAPDIDDEQINGRNRRRKKKARTNTR